MRERGLWSVPVRDVVVIMVDARSQLHRHRYFVQIINVRRIIQNILQDNVVRGDHVIVRRHSVVQKYL